MITFGLLKQEIIVVDYSLVSAMITGLVFTMPCPLIFPLESFCLEDVTVHETSLDMSWYIFLLDWGVLVKEASQSIKVLMTEKTGSFLRALNKVRFQDIHSKI